MSKKAVTGFVIVLVLFLASMWGAFATTSQSSPSSSPSFIALSAAQLNFYGQQGQGSIDRTINIVGLVNQPVAVTIFPVQLVNNSTGTVIPSSNMQITNPSFTVTKNELETVTISLKTAAAAIGTYQGTILVTASTSASNATVSTISITAKIDIWQPLIVMYIFVGVIFFLFSLSVFIGLAVPPAQKTKARAKAKANVENKRTEDGKEPLNKLKSEESEKLITEEIKRMADEEIEKRDNTTSRREHVKFFAKKKFLDSAKFWAIICGLIAVALWIALNTLPSNSFTNAGGLLSSAIIVPLVGYLIGLVTGKTGDAGSTKPPKS